MKTGTMLLDFKGRKKSLDVALNFLWKSQKVYVMDNHRAAMWCWLQEISQHPQFRLLHIDRHYDTSCVRLDLELSQLPPLNKLSGLTICDYSDLKDSQVNRPLIRWDNYISLFLKKYRSRVLESTFITHGAGDKPPFRRISYKTKMQDVPDNLDHWMNSNSEGEGCPWIVNVDIDYFVFKRSDGREPMFSWEYFDAVFETIKQNMEKGNVACVTIALSPECSGGWDLAEKLASRACKTLGIDFSLPVE